MRALPSLAWVFAYLSLLTVGGGMAAFPELEHLTVDVFRWLTLPQLIHLYSAGQAAPGPNMMMIVAIGEKVAGVPGALVVVVAFFGPTCLITFGVGRLWRRLAAWPWRAAIQHSLAPVSVGLILAGAMSLARGALTTWLSAGIAAAVFALVLLTRFNPALLVLGGAVVGIAAWLLP